ncbi:MAG TPA: hypothetical protein VK832_17200 [Burkholderiaceae bacterium]|jgi:hypothetical protein|nr:hypothetical protein [Burkholderiaceae bacterium]
MNTCKQPSKEQVRAYMQRRIAYPSPLPDIQQIRRELGMTLIEAYRTGK